MWPAGAGGGLFWRVYLSAVIFLAVSLLVVLVAVALTQNRKPELSADPNQLEHLAGLMENPAALQKTLDRLGEEDVRATVFRWDGTRLASSSPVSHAPLTDAQRIRLRAVDDLSLVTHAEPLLRKGERLGYVLFEHSSAERAVLSTTTVSYSQLTAVLLGVLLLVALLSLPAARAVTAPLEALTGTVRAFGEGDLRVRSGLRRRDEVGVLAAAFDEMADRMDRLVRSEKELLANISHELRTPISRLRLALEIAELEPASLDKAQVDAMAQDLAELEQLVEDVLITARLETKARDNQGLPVLQAGRVHPEAVIEEALSRFRLAHPERRLEAELAESLPGVQGDPKLLRRVLDNLLDNAQKYSDPQEPVKLVATADPVTVRIEVRDRGMGMNQQDVNQLFTPFFRTDRSRARGTGGVGLGLALSRRIVEAHGGKLVVESMAGLGTVVRLLLPTLPERTEAS